MHINSRSITHKLVDIQILLQHLPISILAVTETWLNDSMADSIFIPGYTFVYENRVGGQGGGVGIFVRNGIDFNRVTNLGSSTSFESLFINLPNKKSKDMMVGAIYRPPGLNLNTFNTEFDVLIDSLSSKTHTNKRLFLLGDYNIDLFAHDSHAPTQDFIENMTSHHLVPLIHHPTRITTSTNTLIDNIFTNAVDRNIDSAIIMTDISDHLPIITRLINSPVIYRSHNKTKLTRTITNETLLTFKNMLSQTDWIPIKQLCLANETNLAYDSFISLIKYNYDLACPLHIKKTSKKILLKILG
jgi:exonuclease III